MSYPSSLTMRLCRHVFAAALVLLATPLVADPARPVTGVSNDAKPQEPDTDIFALMSGKCSTLKIAGHDFSCRTVGFFHSEEGRTNFTIAVEDPTDSSHVISFSGENGRRDEDNLYELPIDRMLLSSKDRPKADGLPVPSAELATGICRQVGNFALLQVSSVACSATDKNGRKYDLKIRIRRFADDLAPGTAVLAGGEEAPRQAKRADRMPLPGRDCEGAAERPDRLYPAVPGSDRRKIALARAIGHHRSRIVGRYRLPTVNAGLR